MMPEFAVALFLLLLGGAVVITGELDERRWRRESDVRRARETAAE